MKAAAEARLRSFGASAGNLRGSKAGSPTEAAIAAKVGGARRDRTDDLLLAKQALSQLSYGPVRYQKSGISSQGYFLTPDYRCLLKVGGPGKI